MSDTNSRISHCRSCWTAPGEEGCTTASLACRPVCLFHLLWTHLIPPTLPLLFQNKNSPHPHPWRVHQKFSEGSSLWRVWRIQTGISLVPLLSLELPIPVAKGTDLTPKTIDFGFPNVNNRTVIQ